MPWKRKLLCIFEGQKASHYDQALSLKEKVQTYIARKDTGAKFVSHYGEVGTHVLKTLLWKADWRRTRVEVERSVWRQSWRFPEK